MEYRDDLERLLLEGLTPRERQETEESMTNATASKLGRLRPTGDEGDDEDGRGEAAQA
jgi:hypothetical protein